MKDRDQNCAKTTPGRRVAVGTAGCPHGEAHWERLLDVGLWAYSCPCGAAAYGITLADANRVFRDRESNPNLRVQGAARRRYTIPNLQ